MYILQSKVENRTGVAPLHSMRLNSGLPNIPTATGSDSESLPSAVVNLV